MVMMDYDDDGMLMMLTIMRMMMVVRVMRVMRTRMVPFRKQRFLWSVQYLACAGVLPLSLAVPYTRKTTLWLV